MADKAAIIHSLGQVPLLGAGLRWVARRYPEGSVVTISNGWLAGYQWRRSHKYVSAYWLGSYELPVQKCLARELRPGDVFYDIGANAGFFSLIGSKCVGEEGHVFAFEPLPENILTIRNQLELNNITNTTVVEAAVSDSVGEVELCEGPDTSTAHIKLPRDNRRPARSVKAISLDKFAINERPPDFIKMDIEGAELRALQGGQKLLNGDNPPKLLIELHGKAIAQDVCSILQRQSYYFCTLELNRIDSIPLPSHVLALPKKICM